MKKEEITRAYTCARLYYEQGLSQVEIARDLNISRPKVSRLLSAAQKLGIVKISITPPDYFDQSALEIRLRDMYNLKNAVVCVPMEDSEDAVRTALSSSFQQHLSEYLKPKQKIGVGQGTTVYEAAVSLRKMALPPADIMIIPLLGGMSESGPAYQINNIVDLFAGALLARRAYIMAPSICESPEQKQSFLQSPQIMSVVRQWSELDMVIFGLGKPVEESEVLYSVLPQKYLIEMLKHHSSGDILARFIDMEGNILCAESESMLMGIPFDMFLKVPARVCIAGGQKKTEGIRQALNKGYITSLFTDLFTAQRLIGG